MYREAVYKVAVAVSDDNFTTSTLLIQDENFTGTTGPLPTGSLYIYNTMTNLLNNYQLQASSTYTFRVYLYGALTPATLVSYDDFQFGTYVKPMEIPTIGEWGIILLIMLLGFVGFRRQTLKY